ncbi:rCG63463 [Rattus norvegicus]|uniref:RCG63463 n=1 Tax=Rattus norvegicus TaxID=10116 RepID=A6HAF1_RAT|nr:rCG63463 [Rattus norvegicus]
MEGSAAVTLLPTFSPAEPGFPPTQPLGCGSSPPHTISTNSIVFLQYPLQLRPQ